MLRDRWCHTGETTRSRIVAAARKDPEMVVTRAARDGSEAIRVPPAPPSRRRAPERADSPWVRRAPFIVFAAVEAFALILWMAAGRLEWFYRDEWDFLAARKAGNLGDLFRPHNEHWVTVPVLVYRFLYWRYGLRTYFPYRLVGVLVYLTVAALLFAVMLRAKANPWIACAGASLFALFAAGEQNVLRPFQITFTGAVAFALADLILSDHDGDFDRRDAFGLVCGLLALMCSGIAVPMIVAVGISVLWRRGRHVAFLHTAPLGACYAVWWVLIGHTGSNVRTIGVVQGRSLGSQFGFVESGLRGAIGALGRIDDLGVLLAVALCVGLAFAWIQRRNAGRLTELAPPIALLAGTVVFLGITSVGRVYYGAESAQASRYISVTAAMALPALVVAVDALVSRRRFLVPLGVAVFVVGISPHLLVVFRSAPPEPQNFAPSRSLVLTLPRDPLALEAPRSLQPDTVLARGVTVGWLLDGVRQHRIPPPKTFTGLDVSSNAFRLSFYETRGPRPTANCKVLHHRLTLKLRPGDAIGVSDGPVLIVPAHRNDLEGYGLQFLPDAGERVEVLRDVGVVRIVPESPPSWPRVCVKQ